MAEYENMFDIISKRFEILNSNDACANMPQKNNISKQAYYIKLPYCHLNIWDY